MIETASLIVVNLLIAAFIGMIIGYIIGKNSNSKHSASNEEDTKSKSSVNPIFRKNSNIHNKPLVLYTARPSGKDKLIRIKGINLELEKDLNKLGIFHFSQIALWSNKNCEWIEESISQAGCVKNNQWVEQAKILETGKQTVYSQKVDNEEVDVN